MQFIILSVIVLIILISLNLGKVYNKWPYIIGGFVMWYCFMQSGIHATISGVVVAFTLPASPKELVCNYIKSIHNYIDTLPGGDHKSVILNKEQIDALKKIKKASDRVVSPLQRLEHSLGSYVNYFIMPLFAFANAGVVLTASNGGGGIEIGNVTWAVMLGLIVGKFVGIYLFTWLVVKLGWASLGDGMTWKNLTGICMLGGIGFTVSLFIANLSFADNMHLLNEAKMGVLLGTIISGIIGYIILSKTLKNPV